jgi:hypothetical protein
VTSKECRTEIHSLISDGQGHVAAQLTLTGTFTGENFDGLVANGAHCSAGWPSCSLSPAG